MSAKDKNNKVLFQFLEREVNRRLLFGDKGYKSTYREKLLAAGHLFGHVSPHEAVAYLQTVETGSSMA